MTFDRPPTDDIVLAMTAGILAGVMLTIAVEVPRTLLALRRRDASRDSPPEELGRPLTPRQQRRQNAHVARTVETVSRS